MARVAQASQAFLALAVLVVMAAAQRPIPFPSEAKGTDLLITPNIMTGLLVGLLWVCLFLVGFCCLFQVQTPQSFEEKCLVLNNSTEQPGSGAMRPLADVEPA
eukprot:CAMPEP_0197886230 /NCGR_PEP_ID=MMETSP1439-20131203/15915_1 /TAXON_ID=66791 /ORGANISM="Gonyaulax spinifera, Strain CCMP409" /LENGTH=102 /DNA_ID=CAMNT_0043505997 /DNA_START=65 /DNA_END=370 /DNA_ORIENTATION=+